MSVYNVVSIPYAVCQGRGTDKDSRSKVVGNWQWACALKSCNLSSWIAQDLKTQGSSESRKIKLVAVEERCVGYRQN